MKEQESLKSNSLLKSGHVLVQRFGEILNYDYFPYFNKYVYWLKQPVGWIVCATGFSALVGILIGPQGFVLMWSLIAFLMVGAIWPWLGMKGIKCRLEFDWSNTVEKRPTTGRLIVTNRWPIPVFGLTVEGQFLQDIFADEDNVAVGLQRISGLSETEFQWEFEPERRGVIPSDVPTIGTGFPFGLYNSNRDIELGQQMIVWPHCEKLSALSSLNGTNFNIEGALSDRPGHDGDVIGARPFRQGDLLRHVNWAKTARTNKLVVLERQTAASKTCRIVIDLHPEQHFGRGSQSSYEWCIRIAAAIAKHLHVGHCVVRVECIGVAAELGNESTNQRGLSPLMDFLATLPDFEVAAAAAKDPETSGAIDSANVRPGEEIYWIRAGTAAKFCLPQSAAQVREIVLKPDSSEISGSTKNGSPIGTMKRLVIDDWNAPSRQFQVGWERLCGDG